MKIRNCCTDAMAVSSATLLTRQFYEWELRGRGYAVVDFPAELEPPFVPFFGHFVEAPYADDGKRHTALSALKRYFVPDHDVSIPERPTQDVVAFPEADEFPELTIYALTLPKNYSCKTESMEQCLTMLALSKLPTAFEIVAEAAEVTVQITCRDSAAPFVYTQLKAYFPDCTIQETDNDNVLYCAETMQAAYMVDFGLEEEFMRPIATYSNGAYDPYASLFSTIEQLKEGEAIIMQVLFCGTQNAWSDSIIGAVTDDRGGSFFVDAPEMPILAKEKTSRPLFGATIRLAAFSESLEDAAVLLQYSASAVINASTSNSNALVALDNPEYTVQQRLSDLVLRQTHRLGMLLNTRELATLAHFPDTKLSKKLLKSQHTTKKAPAFLRNQPYVLGINEHQGEVYETGIAAEQRLRHLHIIGGTGTGKSTLLHSLIHQDIQSGTGCCVLDPHGDLIDAVLRSIPAERIDDVVIIDPSDSGYPVGLNILSAHSDLERELLASDLVALFKRFSTSWGDQLHSVLANALMAFLYNSKPGHLGDLRKFLIEPQFRSNILATCTDTELAYYWQKEYPLLKTSSIGSILTRLDSFLRPKVIRNMVCQHKGLDFPSLMNSGKIILVKLSQGLIGTENSYLLGAVIVAKLQQAAMARQQQQAGSRVPFFCYIDEFHHFTTESMSTILSGARKFGLGLILAHQDMQQVQRHDADISSSLMSNVGTRICFRLSDSDAKRMQEGFSGFTADDLQNLPVGEAVARVNTADSDFNLSVMRADESKEDYSNDIIVSSRDLYSVPVQMSPPHPQESEPSQETAPTVAKPKQSVPPNQTPPPTEEPAPIREQPARNTQEHRYLQTFIKKMAEQHGYKADIEVPTADGKGQVDIVLEKGHERMAIEVSVSTGAEWELHNIKKCLAGDYAKIVICSRDLKKLQQVKQRMQDTLTDAELSRIALVTAEEIPTLLTKTEDCEDAVTMMKGYRVKVKYTGGARDATKDDIIKRIIKGGQK